MDAAELVFRVASAEDWHPIWPIFRDVVATADTYPYPPNIPEEDARRIWMQPDGDRRVTYVAEMGGEIVATAYLKPNSPGLGDHICNAGWMVAPSLSGRGIGRRFAGWVIDQAKALGFRGMQFNSVVATNTNAIALWQSLGFEIVGTVPDAFRHADAGPTPIHIMYRPL